MKITFKKTAIALIIFGFLLIISLIITYTYQNEISLRLNLDISKLNLLSGIVSGSIGTFWTLAGVLLFVEALNDQLKMTHLQSEIFELNKSTNQIENLRKTLFDLIKLKFEIVNNLSIEMKDPTTRDYFKTDGYATIYQYYKLTQLDHSKYIDSKNKSRTTIDFIKGCKYQLDFFEYLVKNIHTIISFIDINKDSLNQDLIDFKKILISSTTDVELHIILLYIICNDDFSTFRLFNQYTLFDGINESDLLTPTLLEDFKNKAL